jgi:opacity protein-like surface antigen
MKREDGRRFAVAAWTAVPALTVAAALALVCPPAGAQPLPDPAAAPGDEQAAAAGGRLRLDLDLGVLGAAIAMSEREFGLSYNLGPVPVIRFALGIGYALSDRLTLGARLDLGFATLRHTDLFDAPGEGEKMTNTVVEFAALPYLERAFGAGRIQPYLTIGAGYAYTLWDRKTDYNDDMDTISEQRIVLHAGVVGLGGGLRFPLAERVALNLGLLWTIGFGELTAADIQDGPQREEANSGGFAWFTRAEILLGLTGRI